MIVGCRIADCAHTFLDKALLGFKSRGSASIRRLSTLPSVVFGLIGVGLL